MLNNELPEEVLTMYRELTVLIDRVSPGATIQPVEGAKGPCNEIHTPSRSIQCYSTAVPALLAEVFDVTMPELRGEAVLAGVVEFAENFGESYLAFRNDHAFIRMWRNWSLHLSQCTTETARETFYKALYLHLYRLISDFSEGAHFKVSVDSSVTSLLIQTPSEVLLCEHPLAIVSLLSCREPSDETFLISYIRSATRFGEMVSALAKVIDPERFYAEVDHEGQTYH
jgi:hypothetical protein